jgi:hypothetical protein
MGRYQCCEDDDCCLLVYDYCCLLVYDDCCLVVYDDCCLLVYDVVPAFRCIVLPPYSVWNSEDCNKRIFRNVSWSSGMLRHVLSWIDLNVSEYPGDCIFSMED